MSRACDDPHCSVTGEHEIHEPELSRRISQHYHRLAVGLLYALRRYGVHQSPCRAGEPITPAPLHPCTCGLARDLRTYQDAVDAW